MPAILNSRIAQFILFLLVSLALRCASLGDWNYNVDEQFYALTGQRMLRGALLYVDIWDRKPPGLYLTYAAIAAVSPSVIAYRLAAAFFAALGAYGINRLARHITGQQGSLIAGITYLVLISQFGGGGGQTPVFYNALMIAAFCLVAARIDMLKRGATDAAVFVAMFTAGAAITFKQSAAIEASLLGLMVVYFLSTYYGLSFALLRKAVFLALAGSAPILACAAFYGAIGHFAEFWQAVVTSNLDRAYNIDNSRLHRLGILLIRLALPAGLAILGFWTVFSAENRSHKSTVIRFVVIWTGAAISSVLVLPNVIEHYALPLFPPLCILAAALYQRRDIGLLAGTALVIVFLANGHDFNFTLRAESRRNAIAMADYVRRESPDHRLFVFGYPSFLYSLTNAPLPSRLAFPPHLFDIAEVAASGIDPVSETRRILAAQPEVVVIDNPLPFKQVNTAAVTLVTDYIRSCRQVRRFVTYDFATERQVEDVYSRCQRNASRRTTG